MEGEENIDETQELLDTVIPDTETIEQPEVQVPAKPKEGREALQGLTAKDRAEERKRDREAGRSSVLDALNKRAQSMGFETIDEMFKAGPQGKPPQRPVDKGAADAALQSENASLKKTIQGLRSRISMLENDIALRQIAYESDVNGDDIDYALSTMQKHYQKLPSEVAKNFDPQKYLVEELKAKKPGVFRQAMMAKAEEKQVEAVEVNTSPLNGRPPKGPGSVEVEASKASETTPKSAMQMNKDEFQEHLRKKGYRNPASMV